MSTHKKSFWLPGRCPPGSPDPQSGKRLGLAQDDFGYVEVRQDAHFRWLLFDAETAPNSNSAQPVQSALNLAQPQQLVLPYMQLLVAALAWHPLRPSLSVLQFGLGGAAINRWLAALVEALPGCSKAGEQPELTSVEARPAVAGVYRDFFCPAVVDALPVTGRAPEVWGERPGVQLGETLCVMSAIDYLNNAPLQAMDLVLVDIYPASPLQQRAAGCSLQNWLDAEFFCQLAKRLKPESVVALNIAHRESEALATIYHSARCAFKQVGIAEIAGYENLVVYLANQRPKLHGDAVLVMQPLLDIDLQGWQAMTKWIT